MPRGQSVVAVHRHSRVARVAHVARVARVACAWPMATPITANTSRSFWVAMSTEADIIRTTARLGNLEGAHFTTHHDLQTNRFTEFWEKSICLVSTLRVLAFISVVTVLML